MATSIDSRRLRRLDVQGFDHVSEQRLAEVAPWLRMAFGLCASLAVLGTALASTPLLLVLSGIAFLAALSPVHPFDWIYNLGIRRVTGTGPLPKRGVPARFACGMGALWLLTTVWAFESGYGGVGYALGFSLSGVAALVATTDICIPSIIYRRLFGSPRARSSRRQVSPQAGAPGRMF